MFHAEHLPLFIGQVFVRSGWLCLVMDFADGGDLCAAVKERAKSGQLFEESAVPRWLANRGRPYSAASHVGIEDITCGK